MSPEELRVFGVELRRSHLCRPKSSQGGKAENQERLLSQRYRQEE